VIGHTTYEVCKEKRGYKHQISLCDVKSKFLSVFQCRF